MTPLRTAVRARVVFDTYHRPGDPLTQVTFNPREEAAVMAAAEWEGARRVAVASGIAERRVVSMANEMVRLHRATVAVWVEIGGPVPSGTADQQRRFRQAKAAVVSYAQSLGFTQIEGELLSTMRPDR